MLNLRRILKWKFILPIFLIITTSVSLIIVFQSIKTSNRVSHSLTPVKLSSVHPTELYCEGLLIHNDIIIISELGVSFVNISDPLNPIIFKRFYDGGGAHTIRLKGDLLYIADHSQGMEILNISDLYNIVKITNVPVSEDTAGIDIAGDLAFITAPEGLFIYNISNPSSPQSVHTYTSTKSYSYIEVHDNLAFISNPSYIEVIDISNPTNPVKVSTIGGGGFIRNFQIVGNLLFGSNMDRGVEIYDISNIHRVKLLGRFHDGGKPAYIHVINHIAFVADYDNGLEIIDCSIIGKMVEIGQFHEEGDYVRAVQVIDNLAYIFDASGDGLEIIQLWE
ncbi:MAG: LVIVD repeat-containing protein [Candidatus Thorarchaeota archaeon]